MLTDDEQYYEERKNIILPDNSEKIVVKLSNNG